MERNESSGAGRRPCTDRRIKRFLKPIVVGAIAIAILAGPAAMLLAAASLLPTDVKRLAKEHAPIEDQSRCKPRSGCGLNEIILDGRCAPAAAASIRHEEVRFPRTTKEGPRHLIGTLTIPVGVDKRRPGVVLVHGSGPQTRDHSVSSDLVTRLDAPLPVFKQLGDHLARRGFVVLRYDKRTCIPCYSDVGSPLRAALIVAASGGRRFSHHAKDEDRRERSDGDGRPLPARAVQRAAEGRKARAQARDVPERQGLSDEGKDAPDRRLTATARAPRAHVPSAPVMGRW